MSADKVVFDFLQEKPKISLTELQELDTTRYYDHLELYGYCVVIVWCRKEKKGVFDKLVERNIEPPTRRAREIL